MRELKSVFGIIAGLIPVLYCVGFLVYFANVTYFTGVPVGQSALGPTIIGLGVVAMLFAIPVLIRFIRLFTRPKPTAAETRRTAEVFADTPSDFDADDAIARYLAQRETAGAQPAPASPSGRASALAGPSASAGAPARSGFGRKRT